MAGPHESNEDRERVAPSPEARAREEVPAPERGGAVDDPASEYRVLWFCSSGSAEDARGSGAPRIPEENVIKREEVI